MTQGKTKLLSAVLCCIPALFLAYNLSVHPGANPVETLLLTSGEWILNFLLLGLAITPLRKLTNWRLQWFAIRRVVGIATYCYCCFHLIVYAIFEFNLDIMDIVDDIITRKFILAGILAFLIMTPLALTSNDFSQRFLKKKWSKLHKLVYIIICLGILHYILLIKADYTDAISYALVAAVLLLLRLRLFNKVFKKF